MRGTVRAHQTTAIEGHDHRQVLYRHIVDKLVVAALQEGRVNRQNRLHTLAGEPRGKGHRMLLGDTDIEVAVRMQFGIAHHARALAHRRRDAHKALIQRRHVAKPVAKDLRVGGLAAALAALDTLVGHKFRHAVIKHRVGLGAIVAVTFFGDHVQELRPAQLADVFQRGHQRIEVVTIDGADIVKAELLEHGRGRDHALGVLLDFFRQLPQRRHTAQNALAGLACRGVKTPGKQAREVFIERTHRRRDRHVVVVENDQQVGVGNPGVIERFKGHAGGHRAVADDRHSAPLLAGEACTQRHAERRGNRSARMRRAEGVVLAFRAARKAGDTARHAQLRHAFAPAGQDFVRVSLVSYVPDQAVARRVKNVMQRDGEFYGAEVGR